MVRHSRRVLLHFRLGYSGPHNPGGKPPVWPLPRSLAATEGISFDFFSSRYLDVSVPWVCPNSLCIQLLVLPKKGVPPFGNLRIKACLAAPRSISQLTTSFIAAWCQGIHRTPLVASLLALHLAEPNGFIPGLQIFANFYALSSINLFNFQRTRQKHKIT